MDLQNVNMDYKMFVYDVFACPRAPVQHNIRFGSFRNSVLSGQAQGIAWETISETERW